MWINRKPRLSPTVYNSLQSFVEFKVDMHNIYIRARKDLMNKWTKLPFVATNDAIFNVLEVSPLEWHTTNIIEIMKLEEKKKKDDAKPRITQLEKKRRKEIVIAKVRVE